MSLRGKVAVVTGASGGLGRSICRVLTDEGASVLPTDISGERCFQADVATEEGNRSIVDHAVARHGSLDVLVLNAGVQFAAPIADYPLERFDHLMRVMVNGPFLAMKHAWPYLTARPGGRIIVTASTSSYLAEPFKCAYTAAKHAVLGLVKVAALEGAEHGLTANAVGPAGMMTPMVEQQISDLQKLHGWTHQQVLDDWVARHAVKRCVETDEVAYVIAFIASERSSGMTGAFVPVDLGTLAW